MPEHGLGEQHKPETHLIPILLNAAHTSKPFYLFGNNLQTADGSCMRDFLHVLDIAHAHLAALEHLEEKKPSDCFNLGTGRGISVKQMVDAVSKIAQKPIKTIPAPARPGDPPILIADPARANTILQWQPQYSDLDSIIRSAQVFYMQG